jgi:xylulokinase
MASMSIYLGIDIGTSGTKTLAMREDGRILASATETYGLSTPKPGWSEQNPEDGGRRPSGQLRASA